MWYTVAQSRIERRRVCRLPKSRLSSETDRLVLKTVRIGSFRNVAMEHERNVYWSADCRFSFSFLFFYYYLLLSSLSFLSLIFSYYFFFSSLPFLSFLFSIIIFSYLHCLFFLFLFFYKFLFSSLSFSFSFFRFFNHYFLFSSREKMGCRKHELYLGLELTKRALTR